MPTSAHSSGLVRDSQGKSDFKNLYCKLFAISICRTTAEETREEVWGLAWLLSRRRNTKEKNKVTELLITNPDILVNYFLLIFFHILNLHMKLEV